MPRRAPLGALRRAAGDGFLVAALLLNGGAHAAQAPRVALTRLSQLPTPLPNPFDPAADAAARVAEAHARARAEGKLLLIDLGGAWCADCRILAGVMRLPEVAAFVQAHYEVVSVDVGHMDRNLAIPAHWGVRRVTGVPCLLIVDAQDRLVNAGHVQALEDAQTMRPQAIADWLARWTN